MVVTEMATPTAAPPAVSYASIPAMPAAKATSTVPGRSRSTTVRARCRRARDRSRSAEDAQQHRRAGSRKRGDPEADDQGEGGPPGERPASLDESQRRQRRSGADPGSAPSPHDEDRRALEYTDARHDAGSGHEQHVVQFGPGVLRRPTGDLGHTAASASERRPRRLQPRGSMRGRVPEDNVVGCEMRTCSNSAATYPQPRGRARRRAGPCCPPCAHR